MSIVGYFRELCSNPQERPGRIAARAGCGAVVGFAAGGALAEAFILVAHAAGQELGQERALSTGTIAAAIMVYKILKQDLAYSRAQRRERSNPPEGPDNHPG